MLVQLATITFFTMVSAKISRVDIVYPSIETYENGKKKIAFRALEQDIDMMLEPAGDIISEKFSIMNGNGDIIHSTDVASLKRKLYKNKDKIAALHIDEDGPPIINGIINSQLRIKPNDTKTMSEDGRVAHKIIEIKEEGKLFHSLIEANFPRMLRKTFSLRKREAKSNESKCLKLEYLFVTESYFTDMFYDKSEDINIYIANTLNKAKILLNTLELDIQTSLMGIIAITKGTENSAPYIKTSHLSNDSEYLEAFSLLKGMKEYYCNKETQVIKYADIIMLLVNRSMFAKVETTKEIITSEGVAFAGGICERCNKFAISRHSCKIDERADTIAHETAHLLGCVHDGDGPLKTIPGSPGAKDCPASQGYILGDRIGENAKKFSPCCKKNVENLIKHKNPDCLLRKCF